MWLIIYAIVITVLAVIFAILTIKWKIATHAITYFCISNFREPTSEEIADCSKKAIGKMFGLKE